MNCCSYLTYTEVLFYPDPDFDFSFRLLTSVLASGGICLGRDWKLISVNDWGPGSACTSLCKWEWVLGHQLKTCSSWSHTGSGNLRESAKEYWLQSWRKEGVKAQFLRFSGHDLRQTHLCLVSKFFYVYVPSFFVVCLIFFMLTVFII